MDQVTPLRMRNLLPLLRKRAGGREIAELKAYEA